MQMYKVMMLPMAEEEVDYAASMLEVAINKMRK